MFGGSGCWEGEGCAEEDSGCEEVLHDGCLVTLRVMCG